MDKRVIQLLEGIVNSPKIYDRIIGKAYYRPRLVADDVLKLYIELCIKAASQQPDSTDPNIVRCSVCGDGMSTVCRECTKLMVGSGG